MIYLIFSILLSSGLTIALKIANIKKLNADNVVLCNYVFAFVFALSACIRTGRLSAFGELPHVDFASLFAVPSGANSVFFAIVLGLMLGGIFFGNVIVMKYSVVSNGAGITAFFGKTGFIITTLVSLFLWRELPTALQWLGIGVSITALVLMMSDGGSFGNIKAPHLLLLLFAGNAVVEIDNKSFTMYALAEYKDLLVLMTFTTALLLCGLYTGVRRRQMGEGFSLKPSEIALGICMGLPNVLSSFVQLLALQKLPASVFFPSNAAGALIFNILMGRLAFHEKLSKRQVFAVGLAVGSLVLINL